MLLTLLSGYSKSRTEFKNEFKWIQNLEQKNWKLRANDIEKQIIKTDKDENLVLQKE